MANQYKRYPDKVAGLTSKTSGERWISVTQNDVTAFALHRDFVGRGGAYETLSRQGVNIIGADHVRFINDRVNDLRDFSPGDIVERIGWNKAHFALQDGTVFSPKGKEPCAVVIEPVAGKNDHAGKLRRWLSDVAAPLTGQSVAMFVMMLAFVPPLLALTDRADNFGFELVGGRGIGKSTLQRLMASILGGIGAASSGRYGETFDTTLNALETQLKSHSDLPLILDEAALFFAGGSDKQRSALFQAFAFKMATGDEKGRLGASRARGIRTAYLSSSNVPLEEVIGTKSVTAGAAGDRLITIQLLEGRPYGVFDHLPEKYSSTSQYARKLIAAASKNHGVAIRHYLAALVQARADSEKQLRKDIRRHVKRFQTKVEVDENSGTQMRVSEAFGLVYAAGALAKRFGVLPASWAHGGAVANCYELYRASTEPSRSPVDRLIDLADGPNTIKLAAKRQEIPMDVIKSAEAFIVEKDGRRELLIEPGRFERLFPNYRALLRQREIIKIMTREGSRNASCWRRIAPKVDKRVYCFNLPARQTTDK